MPAKDICMFTGPEDDAAFRAYAKSIGLTLLPSHAHKMTPQEVERVFDKPNYGGYFSYLPLEKLHRHPHPNIGLCEALDPLISYIRCGYEKPYLVASVVSWYTDSKEMAQLTKPYYQKLQRWVRANWRRREEDGYYIGPEAERILREDKPQIAYLPPDVTVKTVVVD